jgi:long-chain acyl-CoA synthetase
VVATNPLYTPRRIEHQASDAGIEYHVRDDELLRDHQKSPAENKDQEIHRHQPQGNPASYFEDSLHAGKREEGRIQDRGGLRDGDVWIQDLLAKYPNASKPNVEVGPDDTALFQYSGGTTGISKGAVAMHRNVVANTLQIKILDAQPRRRQRSGADGHSALPCVRHGGGHELCHGDGPRWSWFPTRAT